VRKLAGSRHGSADVIRRAQMVVKSWAGKNPQAIADELDCHPQTVRERVVRFDQWGIEGMQDGPDVVEKPGELSRSAVTAWA
jgi:hypothetical protein